MLLTLLRLKAQIWKNSVFRAPGRRRWRRILGYGVSVYLGWLVFQGILGLFQVLQEGPAGAAQAFMTTVLSGLIAFALFWGVGSLLSQLYISSDLELLLAAPLRSRTVYLLKLLEGVRTLLFPGLMSLSSIVAYGVVSGASWAYYLLGILGFLCLAVLLTAVAMALVIFVVRLLPASRAREIWMLLWTVGIGLIWATWMLSSNRGGQGLSIGQLLRNQPLVTRTGQVLGWSPAGWLARMLYALQAGDVAGVVGNLALLLAATGVAVALGYGVYQRAFYIGWSRLQEQASGRRRGARKGAPGRNGFLVLARLLPNPMRALAAKEWMILPRDLRQLSGLFFPILMGVIYVYLTATGEVVQQLPGAGVWLTMAVAPLVPFFLALYYVVGNVGLEKRNFALLRIAPLSGAQLLWGKYLAALMPVWLISQVIMVGAVLIMGATVEQALVAVAVMTWFALGFVAIATGGAFLNPNFEAENARRAVGMMTTYTVLLLNAIFWVVQLLAATWLLTQIGPPGLQAVLRGMVEASSYELASYLDSALVPLLIAGAEVVVLVLVALLWRRGINWVRNWQITDLE